MTTTVIKTGNEFLSTIPQNLAMAADGFVDFDGAIPEDFIVETKYDGYTWAPHLASGLGQYSDKILAEKLAKLSAPITRDSLTGKLVVIDAFGGKRYALQCQLKGEAQDILLPEHEALYARLDRCGDEALIRVRCLGFYEEANQHGNKTTQYEVGALSERTKPTRELLYPELRKRAELKRAKDANKK